MMIKPALSIVVSILLLSSFTSCYQTGVTSGTEPEAPEAATITSGSEELSLSWTGVTDADYYEVWYDTVNDSSQHTQSGERITGTSHLIGNLVNGTSYWVWLKAANSYGTSRYSPEAEGLPHLTPPGAIILSPGDMEMTVFWNDVNGAESYELWYNTIDNSSAALQSGGVLNMTSHTIPSLINSTPCYVWLRSVTPTVISAFSSPAMRTPGEFFLTYDGNTSTGGAAPVDSITHLLNANATVLDNTGVLTRTYSGGQFDEFQGWCDNPEGTGVIHILNDNFNIGNSDKILYAKWFWKDNGYLSLNEGGGDMTDYAALGAGNTIKPPNSITIEMWVNATDWESTRNEKLISNTEPTGGFSLSLDETQNLDFALFIGGIFEHVEFDISEQGLTGWHHIAATYDNSNMRLYIDGIDTGVINSLGGVITYDGGNETIIGAEAGPAATPETAGSNNVDYFIGKLDDIRIWDIVRNQVEISSGMDTELAGIEPGLVAYYKCNDGTGVNLTDSDDANNNQGTLNGPVFGSGRF